MIDELLSDKALNNKHLQNLKNNKDGKIIDHIYSRKSLLDPMEIYHIGDSKYYKQDTQLSLTSNYKQFTYAKNIIQLQFDLFYKQKILFPQNYRDPLTEG